MFVDKALFIVASPFQALCSIEAVHHYNIKDAHFLLFNLPIVMKKTAPIVVNMGPIHLLDITGNVTLSIVKGLYNLKKEEKFRTIFIGDYYNYEQYASAVFLAEMKSSIIYLDDGNSTLLISPPVSLKRGRTHLEKVYYGIWNTIAIIKGFRRQLFTIFDLAGECPLPTEKNTFANLKSKSTIVSGVYVIGTNTDLVKFKYMSYEESLRKISAYVLQHFKDDDVFYCPHRGDSHDYSEQVRSLGWNYFVSEYGVEIDFVQKNIYPKLVIGFGSTALLTLKKIFPQSRVETIRCIYDNKEVDRQYQIIEEYHNKNGIRTIFL